MNAEDLFEEIVQIAHEHDIGRPYLVGGVPRSIIMDDPHIRDFDITTGDKDIFMLAQLVAESFDVPLKSLNGGAKKAIIGNLEVDFSSNFQYANLDDMIKAPLSPLAKETLCRDFTINTLLMPLDDMEKVIDITGHGIKDIEQRTLRCPLDCETSFIADPARMLRALYFNAVYDFDIPSDMMDLIIKHQSLMSYIDRRYAGSKLNEMLEHDGALDMLIETGLINALPMTKKMMHSLVRDRRLLQVIDE